MASPILVYLNLFQKFYFEAYQTFNYNEFPEINSFTPASQKELLEIIKKIRFKKNKS